MQTLREFCKQLFYVLLLTFIYFNPLLQCLFFYISTIELQILLGKNYKTITQLEKLSQLFQCINHIFDLLNKLMFSLFHVYLSIFQSFYQLIINLNFNLFDVFLIIIISICKFCPVFTSLLIKSIHTQIYTLINLSP